MKLRKTNPRTLFSVLLIAMFIIPAVGANHIRVMTVHQSGVNGLEVTLQVDFNPSGDCCGGQFQFNIGETIPVIGSIPDGISSGSYVGDVGWTTQAFYGGSGRTFEWQRFKAVDDPLLVRIEIKYSYLNSGTYLVASNNCCPQSETLTPVTTGNFDPQRTILALEIDSNQALRALRVSGFSECGTSTAGAICYDPIAPTDFTLMSLATMSDYDMIYVGSQMSDAALAALNAQQLTIDTYIQNGGGMVVYAQDGRASGVGYSWLPGGTAYATADENAEDVEITPRGQAHMTYMNQFSPTVSDWTYSRYVHFTAWPAFMDGSTALPGVATPLVGPVATGSTAAGNGGKAVSLAADHGTGCVFASGQPIDLQTGSSSTPTSGQQSAAQQLVRSTVQYGLDCVELATSQVGQ